ncbi:MAG: phosphate ABC transporter ATP-binding protein [Acidimicrobiales bacterium]
MGCLFELDHVEVEIGGRRILTIGHLTIAARGITALAGPSGSGKSTLLRLLNRLEVPSAGVVRFQGDDIAALDPLRHRRQVGMVFQRPAPFPGSVRDNLRVARGVVDDGLFADALGRAGLDGSFLERRADDLSGGEAQRMCLARTLVTQPEVLLLDEPTSSLDPAASRQLERQARTVADRGMPLVWVSHDLDQVGRLADEVVVLVDGRLADADERPRFLDGERATDHRSSEPEEEGQ